MRPLIRFVFALLVLAPFFALYFIAWGALGTETFGPIVLAFAIATWGWMVSRYGFRKRPPPPRDQLLDYWHRSSGH